MSNNSIYAGELLVKLCELSRTHNVEIGVRQSPINPNTFEIKLYRDERGVSSLIDTTRTWIGEPERAADYVFHKSLYGINRLDETDSEDL